MNAAGWFVVGACAGAVLATFLVGMLVSGRRADDLAEMHDRERQAAWLKLVLGSSGEPDDQALRVLDDDGPVAG